MKSPYVLVVMLFWSCALSDAFARNSVEQMRCLSDVTTARVLALELPGGAHRYVEEFRMAQSLPAASRRLALSLHRIASPGHLLHRQVGQWQTYSFWLKERFCVIQLRAAGVRQSYGLLTTTDYGLTQQSGLRRDTNERTGAGFKPPSWWPHLQAARVERWLDSGKRVTTITGFSVSGLAGTREQLIRAATRGGFIQSAQMLVPSSAIGQARGNRDGLMLLFQRDDHELVVTLTAMARLTSVVAHLEEQ